VKEPARKERSMNALTDRFATLPAVEADLFYLRPMAERPRSYTYDPGDGTPQTNTNFDPHRVAVRNVRAVADKVDLDREGFRLVTAPTATGDFDDEAAVTAQYYAEATEILLAATGATKALIFDHTIRRRIPGAKDWARDVPRQPVPRVHVDHTARSGPQNVRDRLGDEAEALLQGRVRIINLWRPITGPLHDAPLAVCDAGSVDPVDLVPTDLVYPHRTGETYSVLYSPNHRWFYAPGMARDEALLLKCYDSATDGRARFAPHTAFQDPLAPADAAPRESIEVRALLFG
jgi:hypothetical protein